MGEDAYVRLREFMDTLPAGYPATPTGVEIKILKKLFSPEEAELTMKLKGEPEEVPAIAARVGLEESELAPRLEEMAQKGLIFRVREGNRALYQAYQFIVGIYEFQLKNLDAEFCRMYEEYLPHFGLSLRPLKTKQLRVVPVDSAIQPSFGVEGYNQIRKLVKEQKVISVAECICRKEQGLMGKECDRPKETCLGFGEFGRFYIDNGLGRAIQSDEALRILDQAEEAGLVLCPSNSRELASVCCCCPCCCPILKFGKMMPRPADIVPSYYRTDINKDRCTDCAICLERCQMGAIKKEDGTIKIAEERCIGCGLCVSSCPEEAISLVSKPGMESPPPNVRETLRRIQDERIRLKTERARGKVSP
jgi:electron transport complex protein RnfB